ncbi:hypothetical protein ACGFOU_33700 [Streptomyces sp. NPDC048595]|uniref:helix-turn-helix domain-containing protein n=1 Tax=Streptomyces sp. NPDC048595 TaxID=3365576 RepID=UPI003716AD50
MSQDEARRAAIDYGEALRHALEQGRGHGASQRQLAAKAHKDPSVVSRYLGGELTAPKEFVTSLVSYLETCGVHLSDAELESLHERRRTAEKNSGQNAARIAYWKERVALMQRALADETTARQSLSALLNESETELDILLGDLASSLKRAQQAEAARDELRELTAQQRKQLEHAQRYTRQLESELAGAQAAVRHLQHEVSVLRAQVRRLLEGAKEDVKEVRVPMLKRESGIMIYITDPWNAKKSPLYQAVDAALQELRTEFEAACEQCGVKNELDRSKAGRELAKATGDARWVTVGDNVDHLYTVGLQLYGSQEARHGEGWNVPPMTPTAMTSDSFVVGAATVRKQIKALRQGAVGRQKPL